MTPAEKLRVQKSFQSRDGKYLHREFRAKRGRKFGSLTRSPDREGGVGRFDVTHPTAATSLLVVAARPRKGVPMAPILPAGVRTLVNRSPHSEAGNPLNDRLQALDFTAVILPKKTSQNQKKGVYII